MHERRSGLLDRRNGNNLPQGDYCPVDPECYYRTKQQVEINTKKLDYLENARIVAIETQIAKFLDERHVAEGVFKGAKGAIYLAFSIVIVSIAIVISLFIALVNGKLSLGEFLKIVF